jgi:hypothetical protein
MKTAGKCIFCGGGGLTKEHVWSAWLHHLLPSAPYHFRAGRQKPIRQGSAKTIKLRVVCRSCNNGWMSRLDENVKPILTPLVCGQALVIDSQSQAILAAWVAMKVMIIEFDEPSVVLSSQVHRTKLMNSLEVPDGWQIWLGHCQGLPWKQRLVRNSASWAFTDDAMDGAPIPNTKSFSLGIGELFVQVLITAINGLYFTPPPDAARFLRPVWPHDADTRWPPGATLKTVDCDILAEMMDRTARALPQGPRPEQNNL